MASFCGGPCWGLNHLRYLSLTSGLTWTLAGIALIALTWSRRPQLEKLLEPGRALPAWATGLIFLVVALLLPGVATPLLGDGVDRVLATTDGWKALQGQPAPLDFVIHILASKLQVWPGESAWTRSLNSWRAVSLAGGLAACVFVWKLACLRSANKAERWFIFFTVFGGGTAVFFLGYAENYVVPAAAVYGFLMLMEAVRRKQAPAWTLYPALAILAALHFFLALVIPPALYVMHRHGLARLDRWKTLIAAALLVALGALAFFMVEEHYRGLAAIFVSGENIISSYHLLGFLNQQILACPGLPLLLPLALLAGPAPDDPLQSFAFYASIIFIVFFFFLRPVIGPAKDWDLFALPSIIYTPWMVLRIHNSFREKNFFPGAAVAVMVLVVVSTGPWISVNAKEKSSVKRYREIMEEEAKHNSWSASYGYYRLARYFYHEGYAPHDVTAALSRAVEINPDSATLRLQVSRLFFKIGREGEAERHLFHHYRILGRRLLEDGKPKQAAQSLEKALPLCPENLRPKIWEKLVRIYESGGEDPARARYYRDKLESRREADNN
ncbi:MAG: hypothetical protein R6V10_15285 [bacterium]